MDLQKMLEDGPLVLEIPYEDPPSPIITDAALGFCEGGFAWAIPGFPATPWPIGHAIPGTLEQTGEREWTINLQAGPSLITLREPQLGPFEAEIQAERGIAGRAPRARHEPRGCLGRCRRPGGRPSGRANRSVTRSGARRRAAEVIDWLKRQDDLFASGQWPDGRRWGDVIVSPNVPLSRHIAEQTAQSSMLSWARLLPKGRGCRQGCPIRSAARSNRQPNEVFKKFIDQCTK